MAYAQIDPWGEERADLRNGIACSLMANAWRVKGSRRYSPQDFIPKFEREIKPQTVEEQLDIARAWAAWGQKRVNGTASASRSGPPPEESRRAGPA